MQCKVQDRVNSVKYRKQFCVKCSHFARPAKCTSYSWEITTSSCWPKSSTSGWPAVGNGEGRGRLHSPNGVVWTVQMYETYSSKWTTVQWTAYVTSIWTVQMDDGPMDRPCNVNLDGPLDRLYYGNLDRPKLRLWTVILDRPKIRLWTVILDRPKLRLLTVILDDPK